MDALQAAALVIALMAPFHVLVWLECRRLARAATILRRGVTIRREDILEARRDLIGSYQGCEIYDFLSFKGMRYRFERIVPPAYAHRVAARELYLEPGLLYVAQ